jgi:hypothetical protein
MAFSIPKHCYHVLAAVFILKLTQLKEPVLQWTGPICMAVTAKQQITPLKQKSMRRIVLDFNLFVCLTIIIFCAAINIHLFYLFICFFHGLLDLLSFQEGVHIILKILYAPVFWSSYLRLAPEV